MNKIPSIELSSHAREVIKRRNIEIEWLGFVIENPEIIEQDAVDVDLEPRLARISQHGNSVLRVVMSMDATPTRLVTAYIDRNMSKRI